MWRSAVTIKPCGQYGTASVEFGLVCLLVIPFLMATMEYGRLLFVWNALPEVTRRAARAAAVADFTDANASQALRRAALFRSDDGPLLLAPNVSGANLRIEYLWQDAGGNRAPVQPLPACPAANRINCARDPHSSSCISFVRVRLCGTGAECPPLDYQPLLPMVPVPDTMPPALALVPAESLGYAPGQPPCP